MSNTGKVVAVLDDEIEFRKALHRLLTGRGFRVAEYECGRDLLSAIDSDPPDCLLLDLHLPELSGFEVLEALRSRQPHIPVVVITADDEPGTPERVLKLGAFAYLKKPVDRDCLLDCMGKAMAGTKECQNTSEKVGKRI